MRFLKIVVCALGLSGLCSGSREVLKKIYKVIMITLKWKGQLELMNTAYFLWPMNHF